MDVYEWAQNAPVGERRIYAKRGFSEAHPPSSGISMRSAHMAHRKGLVFLYQVRSPHGWDYGAQRISETSARLLGIHPSQTAWQGNR